MSDRKKEDTGRQCFAVTGFIPEKILMLPPTAGIKKKEPSSHITVAKRKQSGTRAQSGNGIQLKLGN